MPETVLTRKRSSIARILLLAVILSLVAGVLPASAHSIALDTTNSCPSTTPSAGFTDIGAFDATTQLAINCLFAFGITTGTSATTYSPNLPVARWQMALFLIRQAADHGLSIPTAANQGYTDIGTLPQSTQDAINQITQLGVSKGTSTTTFSPLLDVTRWQMALFIYRLGVAAGVTFTNDSTHNEFADLGGLLPEAVTAINALADAHIALGTGGSLFTPHSPVLRWQMALFLTRLLAADNVLQTGTRVVVTPTSTLALNTGQARTYTATFTNADGTPYTQRVGIQLLDVSASNAPIYNDAADQVNIESTSDGLVIDNTANIKKATGVAGADGIVTFTVRSNGTNEKVIPVAWEDLDGDLTYETGGNVAPTEPFGLGGMMDFVAAAPAEAVAGSFTITVTKTIKANDVFEGTPGVPGTTNCGNGVGVVCSFFYDATGVPDTFTVDGLAATLADFEADLSRGDVVTATYDPDAADQSTFALVNTPLTPLTVTDPAAPVTVDAGTYAIKGTSEPGALIRIKSDLSFPLDGDALDAGEGTVATGTADVDGNWTVSTPLTQNTANNFLATQDPAGAPLESAVVVVPTINESAASAPRIASVTSTNGAVDDILDAGDVLTINFNETMQAPTSNDSVTLLDPDGTRATLTCGINGTTCLLLDSDTITVTAGTPTIGTLGSDGLLDYVVSGSSIESMTGYTGTDANNVDVGGSGAGRVFSEPDVLAAGF